MPDPSRPAAHSVCPPGNPMIGVVASVVDLGNGRFPGHATGANNVNALIEHSGCLPMIVPSVGDRIDAADVASRLDGLLLTGGRANVEPHHFSGPPAPADEIVDPGRDATALALVHACIEQAVPIFGICRGIQEMNVALGGSLHYRLHLLEEFDDHRMPQHENPAQEEVFRLRHHLSLTPGGTFEAMADGKPVHVNSLHGQGIDRLADALQIEAVAEDGVIEAVRLRNDQTFTVGIQWHAEWQPSEHWFGRMLFEQFGRAAQERAMQRHRIITRVSTK